MAHTLPELPYAKNALAPVISEETLEYHYGKHHQAYVNNLNSLIPGTPYADLSLEDTVKRSFGKPSETSVFNNSAQVWNHTFYWHCMSPNGGGDPTGAARTAIQRSFGDFATFKEKFSKAAAAQFGSGWAWLVKSGDGVAITTTPNAQNPLAEGQNALLTLDVWEHAYYIDYRNARPKYIDAFWKIINWDFVNKNLAG